MRAILAALIAGKLRQQFYADVRAFGDDPDASHQVAAGYGCLAAGLMWLLALILLPSLGLVTLIQSLLIAMNAIGCLYGFLQIRARRDPRTAAGVMALVYLATVCLISFQHAGQVAPALTSLPMLAAVIGLSLHGKMRLVATAASACAAVFCTLTISGIIGHPAIDPGLTQSLALPLCLAFVTLGTSGFVWITSVSRDYAVEQLRSANARVLEESARTRTAMEAAKVGLWDVPDLSLLKFHLSESFQGITGYSAEEFDDCFRHPEHFIHRDDITSLREAFAQGEKRLSRFRVDFRMKTKLRGYRWFSARARYSKGPDGVIGIAGSLQDINFIKAAEEALRAGRDRAREANKAKSDFIAIMSHEVRTPLNAILGAVEVMKRGADEREARELVNLIDDAGRGLLAIVNDLLDVSKIEAGKLDIALAPTDLESLVRRIVDFWRPQANAKGLRLIVDCSQASATPILVDAGRVRQVIGNLISNAVKFTEFGVVSTSLEMHETPDGRTEVLISVIDTGPGIPDAIAQSIFAPFEQAPSKGAHGGTGLGLFISRRLARLMGGDLTIEPARRQGAQFRLSLVADRSLSEDDVEAVEGDLPVWAGNRVLCVDDNDNNRRIAGLLLSKFGIDVTPCASGAEALDLCAMQKFDAILMDIVMPDMDGIETLAHLRADSSGLNGTTPVIALTAKLSADDLSAYSAAGFDGVAGKPINVRELIGAVASFLSGQADDGATEDTPESDAA
jgi:signal transduction histidine kinase/ActR/RegA family two-component response regulator